ncbi:Flp family type IVb pilin [Duffyella gerundensis]|uniref:Flp family type IVb pilin n=1 Tax=Duffyella gerundensis TaxID=1619313 RepID=UPI0008372809|nr:Flp family type IVb pilin [Duffyella gerundensis]QTO54488.1 Flp family type IVb pilin [Duffyella gerundensis]
MQDIINRGYIFTLMNLRALTRDKRGVTAIEYALIGVAIATLLSLVLGTQSTGLLGELKNAFDTIGSAIRNISQKAP